ncbi:MAG TPA: methyltransferase domain-containing protein [Candidatus Aminicenantes bacterium]|nr:methyltransferase domain-containing protein [Candidatus Aminicenantes bacterium]HRY64637.1 methyltransferase domain-containing protein [Candidatus Aminicenantes bacterium]HRZ71550.1 methyltransferase domain-containing protein [Candidatus Aminicenantes bacterium]
MRQRSAVLWPALVLLLAAAPACARRQADAPAAPAAGAESLRPRETTVRNVTAHPIGYRIYPAGRPEAVETREIAPGAVDRFPTAVALEVEFNTGRKDATYALDPGSPYSFRYDEGETIDLFLGSHGRADAVDLAPWVPTPQAVVDRMLELAGVTDKDVLYDIGCGDGRIVITAARRYGARGVGIDIDKSQIEASERNAAAAGVERQVKFVDMDATKADISEATVVTLYLLPESNALMRPLLEAQLRPGSRVVCHNYVIPGWEAKQAQAETMDADDGDKHHIYLYIR